MVDKISEFEVKWNEKYYTEWLAYTEVYKIKNHMVKTHFD